MLVCGCGRWMHTEGVDEWLGAEAPGDWLVRFECRACGWTVGCQVAAGDADALVDRLLWSDDARHRLDRLPPYLAPLYRAEVEDYARTVRRRVVTSELLREARQGGAVAWEPEAEERLHKVPAPVRGMARLELERTAAEKGETRVTVALMEEVKARYFGFAGEPKRYS